MIIIQGARMETEPQVKHVFIDGYGESNEQTDFTSLFKKAIDVYLASKNIINKTRLSKNDNVKSS